MRNLLFFVALAAFAQNGNIGPTVNAGALRGRVISSTAPTNGQVYVWNSGTSRWEPGAGGGGGGASSFTQLTDCGPTRTSSTTVTIGGCNVRMGSVVYQFTGTAPIIVSGGSGTVRASIDFSVSPPTYQVVLDSVTITSCTATVGTCTNTTGTSYPVTSLPLFKFTVTGGAVDAWPAGLTDYRTGLGFARTVGDGVGILTTVQSDGSTVLSLASAGGGTSYGTLYTEGQGTCATASTCTYTGYTLAGNKLTASGNGSCLIVIAGFRNTSGNNNWTAALKIGSTTVYTTPGVSNGAASTTQYGTTFKICSTGALNTQITKVLLPQSANFVTVADATSAIDFTSSQTINVVFTSASTNDNITREALFIAQQ